MYDFDRVMRHLEIKNALTRDRINADIEANRKGNLTVAVVDEKGLPVKDATVSIKLKKHEFLHGANIFMLDELESEQKNEKYKDDFAEIFNQATLPFYWCDLEPEQGKPRFSKNSPKVYRSPAPDLCLEFCEERNITPKEHCLTYVDFTPSWVPNDVYKTKLLLEKRYAELAERYSGRIHGWEVINETLCGNYKNDPLAFFRTPDLIEYNFKLAEKYFGSNELIINEATEHVWYPYKYNRSQYYMLIDRAIRNGARIDTIGMQYHLFTDCNSIQNNPEKYLNPERILSVLDTYSELNRPVQITEVTVPAFSNDESDEILQAEIIKTLYSTWFSHKSVEAITYWNLVDGYAAWAEPGDMSHGENTYYGGLVRFDFTKKPAYYAIKDMFGKKWTTSESQKTNDYGFSLLRGFYGDYELTVNAGDRTITRDYKLRSDLPNSIKIKL